MPGRLVRQSLSRAGFTVMELVVGVAVTAIVTGVLVGLLRAAIVSYRTTARTQAALIQARRALIGDGPSPGLMTAARQAVPNVLSPTTLTLSVLGQPVQYALSDGILYRAEPGAAGAQASGIAGLTLSYYGVDADGRLSEAAAPDQAALVTALLTVQPASNDKPRAFFSGAALRNRQ